jgi:hypothetical protein
LICKGFSFAQTGKQWVPIQHPLVAWVLDGFKSNHGLYFHP